MNHLTDQQLLQDYAGHRSETAFAELVRRHVNLVYSAAMRMVRDTHLAEDVSQAVFVALSQNAGQLADRAVLCGWLHRTTRNLAANAVRSDVRRRVREQEAVAMNELLSPDASWEQIAPQLDAALGELSESDRDALLLRYFEGKSAQEMGEILSVSDAAAQKRVNRAVERLREYFLKRNLKVGTGGLVVFLSAYSIQSAPVRLAASITTAVLAGAALQVSTAVSLTKIIAMTTLQKSLITGALAIAACTTFYEAHQAAQFQAQVRTLQQQQTGQLQEAQQERDAATNRLAALTTELAKTKSNNFELLKLRREVTQLHSEASDSVDSASKDWVAKAKRLKQRLAATPSARIPEMQFLNEDDWLSAARHPLDTDNDYRRAMADLRQTAEREFINLKLKPALQSYADANNGQFPAEISQLQPYFATPVEAAIMERWEVAPAKTVPNVGVGNPIITQKAAVDDLLDSRMAVGPNGNGNMEWLTTATQDVLNPVYKAYVTANGSSWRNFDPSQLLQYATTAEQQTAVQKIIAQKALKK